MKKVLMQKKFQKAGLIKMNDLKEYTDALIEFWNAIPTNRWIVKKVLIRQMVMNLYKK